MDYKYSIEKFLEHKGWKKSKCRWCNTDFFYKKYNNSCGSFNCEGGYKFLNYPSRKDFLETGIIRKIIKKNFEKIHFFEENPILIKRNNERTLFASAAGQIYDKLIYEREHFEDILRKIVFQPVIRLQDHEQIADLEGISSSFITAGSEIWNSPIKEHHQSLDKWFDIFSELGILVSNFNLKYKPDINYWQDKKVPSESLKINYRGLEIGIANFFYDINITNKKTTFSDINIGLERLAWAINKTDSYFDSIGPIECILTCTQEKIDALRTLTLMAAAGVVPGTKNHGQKFRILSQKLSTPLDIFPFYELVDYYYNQWSQYIDLTYDNKRTLKIILTEVERMKKQSLIDKYKLNIDFKKDFTEMLKNQKLLRRIRGKTRWD
ncbi:hypothetical protein GF358_00345 [Candidatus Woesearchaeota archaeon]|nr:hypothetical protein [Candidatus Woesearchaeota archaeon]